MTRLLFPETPAVTPTTPTLGHFFERVRHGNPFEVNRVVPSSVLQEDAEQVHYKQYTQLVELAGKAQEQHTCVGVLLWGEAGVGKSHVLARLGKWAGPEQNQAH